MQNHSAPKNSESCSWLMKAFCTLALSFTGLMAFSQDFLILKDSSDYVFSPISNIEEHKGRLWFSGGFGISGWLNSSQEAVPLIDTCAYPQVVAHLLELRSTGDTVVSFGPPKIIQDDVFSGELLISISDTIQGAYPFNDHLSPEASDVTDLYITGDTLNILFGSDSKLKQYLMDRTYLRTAELKGRRAFHLKGYLYTLDNDRLRKYSRSHKLLKAVVIKPSFGYMLHGDSLIQIMCEGSHAQSFNLELELRDTIPYPFPLTEAKQLLKLKKGYYIATKAEERASISLVSSDFETKWSYVDSSGYPVSTADTAFGRMYLGGGYCSFGYASPIDLKSKRPVNNRPDIALSILGFKDIDTSTLPPHACRYTIRFRAYNHSNDTIRSFYTTSSTLINPHGGCSNITEYYNNLLIAPGDSLDSIMRCSSILWGRLREGSTRKTSLVLRFPNASLDADLTNNEVEYGVEWIRLSGAELDRKRISYQLYPNPAKGTLQIMLKTGHYQDTQLAMYDLMGRLVLSTTLSHGRSVVDITAIPSGYYTYQLRSGERLLGQGKLLAK